MWRRIASHAESTQSGSASKMQLCTSNNRVNLVERRISVVASPLADLAFFPLRVRISHYEPQLNWPYVINNNRAGISKCWARLEALLWGPTQWRMRKFLIGHQVIMIKIVDVKRGLGHDPQLHLSSRDFSGQRRNTQYIHELLHSIPPERRYWMKCDCTSRAKAFAAAAPDSVFDAEHLSHEQSTASPFCSKLIFCSES